MNGTPTLWDIVNSNAPVIGWAFLCSCIAFCTRLVWKMRGGLDRFFENQRKDRDLSQKIFLAVEEAKKEALMRVEKATAHGEEKAAELKLEIEKNQATLNVMNTNHLSHIQKSMEDLNGKHDKVVDFLYNIDKNIAVLVDRGK